MHWKELEGRVFRISNQLSTEQIDKIKSLSYVELIEQKTSAHPQGVVHYYRLVLKNKEASSTLFERAHHNFKSKILEELTSIIGSAADIGQLCRPAALLGYDGPLATRLFAGRTLTTEEIEKIESLSDILAIEDLSIPNSPLYCIGLKVKEYDASIVEENLRKIIPDIYLKEGDPIRLAG
jgi:hypothetical protein